MIVEFVDVSDMFPFEKTVLRIYFLRTALCNILLIGPVVW